MYELCKSLNCSPVQTKTTTYEPIWNDKLNWNKIDIKIYINKLYDNQLFSKRIKKNENKFLTEFH